MSEECIQVSLRRLWVRQLQREYAEICFQYSLSLQPAVIALSEGRKQLGSWHPDRRLLSISAYLIKKYPWQVTLQVLKHEMAHQICSEYWGYKRASHGAAFKKACEMLAVEPSFCHAGADCTAALARLTAAGGSTEQGRRIIAKVTKLLALAGSDNEHEAALAMQRATELLARHNMEAVSFCRIDFRHSIINTGRKRIPAWRRAIAAILSEYFFVRVVFATLYDPLCDESHATIELMGRSENVPIAEYCYHFLVQRLSCLYRENRHRLPGHARTARNSYYLGLLAGFRQKLADHELPVQNPEPSRLKTTLSVIVPAGDRSLDEYVGRIFPRLQRSGSRRSSVQLKTYREAMITGRSIVLHQAVEQRKVDQGYLS